jgi:vancomycin permeability regulator SanA
MGHCSRAACFDDLIYMNWQLLRSTPLLVSGRACCLFLGGLTLLNLVGEGMRPGFNANIWWIDTGTMAGPLSNIILLVASLVWLMLALCPQLGPQMRPLRNRIATTMTVLVLALVLVNIFNFYLLLVEGRITAAIPVPVSMFIAAMLLVIWRFIGLSGMTEKSGTSATGRSPRFSWLLTGCCVGLLAMTGPLLQMVIYGKTDYRRPADAIVVFGARAYADGSPSQALADRVRTACDLYHRQYAPRMIFSGGPGDGQIHETQAMRQMALHLGVPDSAILIDQGGLNTEATVLNSCAMMQERDLHRVLAVSHFYHLPRIKMAYQRHGVTAFTVPAYEPYTLTAMPYYMVREVAAFWVYYARPIAG